MSTTWQHKLKPQPQLFVMSKVKFTITKILSGKCHLPAASLVKDKKGKLLTAEKKQELFWTEHFKETLNRPPPQEVVDIPEAPSDLDIDIDLPNREEIIGAIKSLKNGKSPSPDNLNAELFSRSRIISYSTITTVY